VIGAIALLSTLLVGSLVAYCGLARQIRGGQQRIAAHDAVDRMLHQWFKTPELLPRSGSGQLQGSRELSWTTQVIDRSHAENMGFDIVRVTVLDEARPLESRTVLSLDIAVRLPNWPPSNPELEDSRE
jgi:hypothetical protein